MASNERLEFLGDAVLGMVIAEEIFVRYPELPEGQLAKLRAGVVNAAACAEVAREIELGPELLLGKGEASTGGADKQSILADAMEAVVGAVYLDGGYHLAQAMVLRLWHGLIMDTLQAGPGDLDHKTRLQEIAVASYESTPEYEIETSGPDHARIFTATVRVDGQTLGSGSGTSKKEAEQAAAGIAVRALRARFDDPDSGDELTERRAS